jgi:hypothetical protein
MGKAGKGIRRLAFRRRSKAIESFATGALLIFAPVGVYLFLSFLSLTAVSLPVFLYFLPILGISVISRGLYLWKRANHADQGAAGEESIEKALSPLHRQGWQIEYGIRHRAVGDVDIFLISPKGKAFTIDVKSHRGSIVTDEKQLYRLRGKSKSAFEKDFIAQAKKQAITMKRLRKLKFVYPSIVFSNATVHSRHRQIDGVYVMDKTNLVSTLQKLG